MTFEEELIETIKRKVINDVSQEKFTDLSYNQRIPLPDELITKIWDSIKWDDVIDVIRPEIQTRVCNAILGAMGTEIKTDVKKILSIDGVRQRLRAEVYPKIISILDRKD